MRPVRIARSYVSGDELNFRSKKEKTTLCLEALLKDLAS
jgi:hypothetical protein